ncbi:MAG: LysR family transcriptional regulator [Firmicutes bacterium HGW-Firmicutes-11]|nr:MAG: LysR family transcriptional regulator [Firmicutes bacterium HGW-Firmicutes-11]
MIPGHWFPGVERNSERMEFRQIEAFVNVVRYKSFSRAADASFLTQPTISTHISTLEKELGVPLIDRKSKEAIPTPEGKLLYRYALDMINTRERAVVALKRTSQEMDGILEIQTSSVPGEYIIPSLLAGFREQHPKVRFYLEQSDSGIVERNLMGNKGEIGFVGSKGAKELAYEKLISDSMVLITPKNSKFLSIAGGEISIEEFFHEAFVWREQGSSTRKEFEERLTSLGYDPKGIQVVARFNSMEAIKQAVGDGLGVSVISAIAAERSVDTDCRRFLTFKIKDIDLNREFYMCWNRNTALSPRAESFRDYVINAVRGGTLSQDHTIE